ncbi:sugar transferase [Limimaricola sp.]|uniref:sugar transferase n=1 Tax=Limimaricola sp. TaxID=2211665 RepID=UPI004058E5E1
MSRETRRCQYRAWVKRLMDVVLVVIGLPAALPLVLALCALAALDGHLPIYRQPRVGRGGRMFDLIKIRTMVPDADARLARHLAGNGAARAEWDRHQKLRDDPRVTPAGRFMRRLSLDELPQLWNVLRGDMSLVGPRPILPRQQPLYTGRAYYDLRPGLTGLWQVCGRTDTSFAARARFDQDYHRRLCFSTDAMILLRTLWAVGRGTGC